MGQTKTDDKNRANGWSSSDILRAVALGIGLFYALRLLYAAFPVVLIGFLGLLFGLSLGGLAERLQQRRIPRSVTAIATVIIVYGMLVGGAMLLAPQLREQVSQLQETLPQAISLIQEQVERVTGLTTGATQPGNGQAGDSVNTTTDSSNEGDGGDSAFSGLTRFLGPFLSSAASAIAGLFVVTFVAIYIAIDPDTYREGALKLVPYSRRKRIREVMDTTGMELRRWLGAQLTAMAIMSVVTWLGLLALGIESALALGIFAGLMEFVPFIGPIVSAISAIGIALVDSPQKALAVVGFYFVIQQLEATVLTPMIMKTNMKLPPIMTIMAQAIMGVVFGFVGVLVAVPLLAAIMVPVKMLYVEDVVDEAG